MVTESARLVRMTGTRAPSTMPAASASARNVRLCCQHVARFQVRHDQHVRAPGHRRFDVLDLGRLQADRVVERERAVQDAPVICLRSAILHKAAASMVEGTLGLTVSIAERMATRTSCAPSACARSMAFCTMSTLSSSVGAMFTAASDTIRGSELRRHVHHEAVADAPGGAQPAARATPPLPSARRCAGCPSSGTPRAPRARGAPPRRPRRGCAARRSPRARRS